MILTRASMDKVGLGRNDPIDYKAPSLSTQYSFIVLIQKKFQTSK